MRISDWSSDVCSSDLFVWPLRISDQSAAKRNHVELFTFDAFSDFLDIVGNDCAACFKRSKQVFRQADATDRHRRLASQLSRPRRQRQVRPFNCGDAEIQCRSEEHTSELQSLMRISYAGF